MNLIFIEGRGYISHEQLVKETKKGKVVSPLATVEALLTKVENLETHYEAEFDKRWKEHMKEHEATKKRIINYIKKL